MARERGDLISSGMILFCVVGGTHSRVHLQSIMTNIDCLGLFGNFCWEKNISRAEAGGYPIFVWFMGPGSGI